MRMSHMGPNTHPPGGGEGGGEGSGGWGREHAASRVGHQYEGKMGSLLPRERMKLRSVNSRRHWYMADEALTRGHWATAAHSGDTHPHTHHTAHHTHTYWGNT